MTAVRIQRQRTKGWRMPDRAVYVGRPSLWQNPFPVAKYGRNISLEYFRAYLRGELVREAEAEHRAAETRLYGNGPALLFPGELASVLLRDRDLACWCPLDQPCHADVLLELTREAPAGEPG